MCRPGNESVLQREADLLPNRRYRQTRPLRAHAAGAGVTTVGLRPPFVTPAPAHSHPDCRRILILIVAPQIRSHEPKRRASADSEWDPHDKKRIVTPGGRDTCGF